MPCVEQTCINGACTGTCAAGASVCHGNGVEICSDAGAWGSPTSCIDQTCVDGGCAGVCGPTTPPTCSGNQPETCGSDGQWHEAGPPCAQPEPECGGGSCICVATICAGSGCVDTTTDPQNCGACGVVCSGTCTGGRCLTKLPLAVNNPGGLATDGMSLYVSTWDPGSDISGTLYRLNLSTAAVTALVSNLALPAAVAVKGSTVYFGNEAIVYSVPATGGTAVPLSAGNFYQPISIAIGATSVYFADGAGVREDPLVGPADAGAPTVFASSAGATSVALDSANVYYGNGNVETGLAGTGVFQAPISGAAKITLDATSAAYAIAVDATNVYWTTGPAGTVLKTAKGGGAPVKPLAWGLSNPRGIAIDATNAYFTDVGRSSVMKVPLDGSSAPTVLATGQALSLDNTIVVDAASVYFATTTSIMKVTPR